MKMKDWEFLTSTHKMPVCLNARSHMDLKCAAVYHGTIQDLVWMTQCATFWEMDAKDTDNESVKIEFLNGKKKPNEAR